MLLNPDNSEILLVAGRAQSRTFAAGSVVVVAGSHITFAVKFKSLGVTIDQSLSFDQHARNMVKAVIFTSGHCVHSAAARSNHGEYSSLQYRQQQTRLLQLVAVSKIRKKSR